MEFCESLEEITQLWEQEKSQEDEFDEELMLSKSGELIDRFLWMWRLTTLSFDFLTYATNHVTFPVTLNCEEALLIQALDVSQVK